MNVTRRKPKTMESMQLDFDTFDSTSTRDILKNYEKSIIIMTKNLENKEITIKKMTEEFEENEILFNDVLKENTRIKKELCESKIKINLLEETLNELKLTNEILEESEYKSHLSIQPLHQKLNTVEREKDELQSKYSQLLINHVNRNDFGIPVKNISLRLKKKKRKNKKHIKNLMKKFKRQNRIIDDLNKENYIYNENIQHLNNDIVILTTSITERDKLLKDLQAKLNEAIKLAEVNIINKSRYSDQLNIIKELEITILQLQKFVNNKITMNRDPSCNKKCDNSLNDNLSREREKVSIKIVGDYVVKNLGSKLKENLGKCFDIDCNVFTNAPIQHILSSAQEIINNCTANHTTILMVLIKNFMKEDFKKYLTIIKKMTDSVNDTKIRLIFSNIPYEDNSINMRDDNIIIQKINSILNCISSYSNNLNLFNVSNLNTRILRRDQYQDIVIYFIKSICKNYGYINNQHRNFTNNQTSPMNT